MADPYRKSRLAKIHLGRKALHLDEATYRAVLARVAGKTSAGAMTPEEHGAVIREMVRLGADLNTTQVKKNRPTITDKILRLWEEMGRQGIVENGSRSALGAWLKRRYQVDDPRFLTVRQAINAVEALKQWQQRNQRETTQ